jgi:trigger factor
MKTALEVISPVKKKLLVEVEPEEVLRKVEETYKSLGKTAKVPGFRPGKIPRRILERQYGSQVAEEVARDLVRDTLPMAMDEQKTYPLTMPLVENGSVKGGEPFKYSAVLEVKPEFDLKDYTGLEVEKEIILVTEEDVEKQFEEIRKANGKVIAVEGGRAAQESDFAIVSYEGSQGGIPVNDLKADHFPIKIGSGEFHPDAEKALLGRKPGDSLRVDVKFEENHPNAKLAGKSVELRIQLQELKEVKLPDLDDEFAKGLGADFQDLNGLRQRIRDELTSREEKRTDRDLKRRLLRKISDKVQFDLPESLVEEEIDYGLASLRENLQRMGSSFEKAGFDQQKLREEFRPAAEKRVKELLVLGKIAEEHGLLVDETEMEEGFARIAVGMNQDVSVVKRYYEANRMTDSFRQRLIEEKTLNFLVKGANVRQVSAAEIPRDEEKTSEP